MNNKVRKIYTKNLNTHLNSKLANIAYKKLSSNGFFDKAKNGEISDDFPSVLIHSIETLFPNEKKETHLEVRKLVWVHFMTFMKEPHKYK